MFDLPVNVAWHRRLPQRWAVPSLAPAIAIEFRVPITWTLDHDKHMLTAYCEGKIGLRDIEAYLDAVVVADTMPYRKLFDASHADSAMTDEEMMALGARIRAYHGTGTLGALAIVVVTEHTHGLARLFGALAAADRPIKIFRDVRAARRWLEAQPA